MAVVAESASAKPLPSRLRRTMRWCRRLLFLSLLGLLYAGVHLNQIGLPDFLKRPLLDQLRARGLSLDFSRLRVRLGRGLIAEHVTIDRPGEHAGEHFYADEIQIKLDWSPIGHMSAPEIRALLLRKGLIQIPVPADAGDSPYLFKVDDVSGLLIFLGPEEWELRSLEASCLGGRLLASGSLTNASILRRTRPSTRTDPNRWKRPLRRLGHLLERARFSRPPVLSVAFHADLRSADKSGAEIKLSAPGVGFGGNDFSDLSASAILNQPPGTANLLPASIRVHAAKSTTQWGSLTDFNLTAVGDLSTTNALPEQIDWDIRASDIDSIWASAVSLSVRGQTLSTNGALSSRILLESRDAQSLVTNAPASVRVIRVNIEGRHSLSNWSQGSASVSFLDSSNRWSMVEQLSLQLAARKVATDSADPPLPVFWQRLAGFEFQGSIQGSNIVAWIPNRDLNVSAHRLATSISWAPDLGGQLSILDFTASSPAGSLRFGAGLNAVSRRAQADFNGALDLQAFRPLLTPAARQWISQYGWLSNRPPIIDGSVAVTLPAWTNRQPDWRGEVVPSLALRGRFSGTNFTFRGLAGDTASGQFLYSNHVWRIPALTATRPEGSITLSYEGNDVSHDYHFHVRSTLDPMIVRPLIDQDRVRLALNDLTLTAPPVLEGDVWGVWKNRDRSGLDVRLAATNLLIRGESIEAITGRLQYTNSLLSFQNVDLRSQGAAHIPGGFFDITSKRLSFSNAEATLDPQRVARVIGPKSALVMSNYHFGVAPETTIHGVIGIGTNVAATDIRFTAKAPEFLWWRLGLTNATARLHFLGETLALTDLKTDLHGGSAVADLFFDWSRKGAGSLVRGVVSVTNLQLAGTLRTLLSPTNRLEGALTAKASFAGDTADTNSWSGSGNAALRDGFLWDLPMFGIFSQLFDAISPGAGQIRFKEGTMTFAATNSVLNTRDLEVRAPTMRLAYRGSVDIGTRLDARMEAELFRDAPLIGPLLTLVLTPFTKLFVYDVKGTLKKPVAEPRYVPKFLLAPLRPFKTLRELLPKDDAPETPVSPPPKR